MRPFALLLFTMLPAAFAQSPLPANDPYRLWAADSSRWGASVANESLRATLWGEAADPDRDKLNNLQEYAFGTDPKSYTGTGPVTWSTTFSPGHVSLTYKARQNDPALLIVPQASSDLASWFPLPPVAVSAWAGDPGLLFTEASRSPTVGDYATLTQVCNAPIDSATRNFTRILILRGTTAAVTSPTDGLRFQDSIASGGGQTVESNNIIPAGFTGTILISTTGGARLIVNGVDVGASAQVSAGSEVRLRGTSPASGSGSYGVAINGVASTWTITTRPPVQPTPVAGTVSGYTPVSASVGENGAANISIPITVPPGTAGMEPKLAITYSSQAGDGPLGLGWALNGISAISRTGATYVQDGFKSGINFDTSDRFAYEGQRLILVTGSHGADGAEYRPEFDPSTRVKSFGASGSGPQRWTVETKSGLTLEFGATANSRVVAPRTVRTGYVRNDIYTGILGTSVNDLINAPHFPNAPMTSGYLPSLYGVFSAEVFGQRIRGYIIPPTTGSYQFHLTSDDDSRFRFNPTGTSEAGTTVQILRNQSSAPLALVAGQPYFFEALHKEQNGAEFVNVAWTGPGFPVATTIAGAYLASEDPGLEPSIPGVLTWAVESIKDTSGNQMTFFYDNAARLRGELLIERVAYTSNPSTGLAAAQEVTFEYEDRPDPRTSLAGGLEVRMLRRLKALETRATDGAVMKRLRRYEFTYDLTAMTQRSALRQVLELPPSGPAFASTFEWSTDLLPPFMGTRAPHPAHPSAWNAANVQTGDINGDGRTDLFSVGTNGLLTSFISNGSGAFDTVTSPAKEGFNPAAYWLGDYNGDGQTDVLTRPAGSPSDIVVYFGNGTGTFTSTRTAQSVLWDQSTVVAADYNGDGRTDFLVRRMVTFPTAVWRCFLSNGDGTFQSVVYDNAFVWDGTSQIPGDFNGDGLTDFLTMMANRQMLHVIKSDGNGYFSEQMYPYDRQYGIADPALLRVGDFNGDGISDAVWPSGGRLIVYLMDGKGGVRTVAGPAIPGGINWLPEAIGDFNGDGLMDILAYRGTEVIRFISRGDGTFDFLVQPQGITWLADSVWPGDFDGDGKTEFTSAQGGSWSFFRTNSFGGEFVKKVINGHGGSSSFAYQSLAAAQNPIHTRGSAHAYPCYDFQAALYAVASVTTRNGADGEAFTATANPVPGETVTQYAYERAWTCVDGRGFRGFKAMEITRLNPIDPARNLISRTEYESLDPLLSGRPARETVRLGDGRIISESLNQWTKTPYFSYPIAGRSPNASWFIYAENSTSKEFEINGQPASPVPVKTTTVSGVLYDAYGNLKHSLTEYGGGFSEEVTSNYDNDTTKWWLGRLRDTTVTQRAPGQPDQTRSSTFEYSPVNGQVKKEAIVTNTTALNLEKTYEFDAFGNIRQSTLKDLGTGETRTTITRYTPDGRFIKETENGFHQIESKTYDPLTGNTKTQTGPNLLTTTWEYDAFGRPEKEIRSDGTTSITQYLRCTPGVSGAPPRAVHCLRTQSAGGGVKMVYFDILDREIRQDGTGFDGQTVSTHTVYDARGHAVQSSQPFFSSAAPPVLVAAPSAYTVSDYDEIGRVKTQTAPGSRVTSTAYAGLTATVTNPLNQTFTTQQDVRGRTGTATSYGSDAVTNIHDPYGNLLEVRDGLGRTTTMRYDARGNKYEMREPNSGLTTYGYNAFGELTRQTDARGITVRLYYDKLGRLERREEPEGTTLWEYDTAPNGIGKLARVSRSADGYEEVYRYDAQGRPVETITRMGSMRFVTGTTYDEYSRPLLTIYPTGFAVRNVYNAQGFLAEVRDATTGFLHWRAEQINARGQVEEESYGNGLTGRRTYYADTGLVKDMQAGVRPGAIGSAFNSVRQNLTVEWDNIGNLKMRQDLMRPGSREDFGYDSRNRLETITGEGSQAMSMTYETDGRIRTQALTSLVAGESYNWTYDYLDPAHPHAVTRVRNTTGGATVRSLGYDAAGNALTDGDVALTYTSNNQPATIRKGSTMLAFSYGPGRARYRQVETTPNGQTTKLYIGGLYEREDTAGSTVHTHFIAGGSGVIAIRTVTESVAGKSEKLRYLHRDHLGSLHTLTRYEAPGSPDAALNGTVDEVLNFDAWGKRRTLEFNSATSSFRWTYATAPSQTDRGFTGHEMLDAVGLVHMNGRIYDPTLGRFLSVDPIVQEAGNLQNLNRYSYVLNNPLSMTDPSGFFFKSIGKFLKKHWKTIVAVGIGAFTGFIAAPALLGSVGTLAAVQGAAFGFGSAFSGTLLAGGSVGDALRAGLRAGAIGGVSAGAADLVGTGFSAGGRFAEYASLKPIVHGVVQGGIRQATGGKFIHGFMSATFADLAAPSIGRINGFDGDVAARTAIAAAIGGTAEAIGGGKFANGAITGAFVHLFNSERHKLQQEAPESWKDGSGNTHRISENGRIIDADAYWMWRKSLGDPAADLAINIGNDKGMGAMANNWLEFHGGSEFAVGSAKWKSLRLDLADAHQTMVMLDNVGVLGKLSVSQIRGYHHQVFHFHGLSPAAFGGTPFFGYGSHLTSPVWAAKSD